MGVRQALDKRYHMGVRQALGTLIKQKDNKAQLKKEMLHLQQFYNIFTTNHRWLVIIGSNLKLTTRLHFCSNNNN